ncbi:MAG: asparagine synthase (glutamine-hydrolyzing) [Bryobacteraceae bacterium]|nr:asparagine synthase (glutamine-hydrolyzing) [Bryobacteraceae bacterium]
MCGIAGFVAEGINLQDDSVIRRMIHAILHRGPDANGVYVDEFAALGHARLSIIDLAGGGQPMCNEDGSLWITFNGEIFNYLELRIDLIARGHVFSTKSDTEVILHLFEEYGQDCVSRLNGQWAFAIWDKKRRRLFLSRDRFGVRPLFYAEAQGAFLFASEIKALFTWPGFERRLDLEALNEIFTFWHTLPPRTAFQGVKELPPGHSALLDGGRITIKRYWDLDYQARGLHSNGDFSEDDCAERLLALLEDATRLRLRADVPVGAYLSGGIDSTLIASLVKRTGVTRLNTFSVRFEDSELDEGPFQSEAVKSLGTEHREILCSNRQIGEIFPDVIWHAEKPVIRTAPAPLYLLARLVRQSGYKVVLTGEGADEVLGGYDIFKEAKVRAFWASQPDSKLRPLLLRKLYPYQSRTQMQSPAYLSAFFHAGEADRQSPFFSHLPRWRMTSRLKSFFSDEAKSQLAGEAPLEWLGSALPERFAGWDAFTKAQYLEASYLLPGYILSSQGDRVAMAHAVEGRFPFLDYRVAAFACKLPSRLLMKVLKEKYLLKRSARNLVPRAVLERHKQPYRAPDARSFFCAGAADYVSELLSQGRIREDGVFHPGAVERLVEKARRGDVAGVADNMAVVGILSTQLLIHRFIRHLQ